MTFIPVGNGYSMIVEKEEGSYRNIMNALIKQHPYFFTNAKWEIEIEKLLKVGKVFKTEDYFKNYNKEGFNINDILI